MKSLVFGIFLSALSSGQHNVIADYNADYSAGSSLSQPTANCTEPLPRLQICNTTEYQGLALVGDAEAAAMPFHTRDWNTATPDDYFPRNASGTWTEGMVCNASNSATCYNHPYWIDAKTNSVQMKPFGVANQIPEMGDCLFQIIFTEFPWPTTNFTKPDFTLNMTMAKNPQECQQHCSNTAQCDIWTFLVDPAQTTSNMNCFMQPQEVVNRNHCKLVESGVQLLHCTVEGTNYPYCMALSAVSISGRKYCDTSETYGLNWFKRDVCHDDILPTKVISDYDGNYYPDGEPQPVIDCRNSTNLNGSICTLPEYYGSSLFSDHEMIDGTRDWNEPSVYDFFYKVENPQDLDALTCAANSTECYNSPQLSGEGAYQIMPVGAKNHMPNHGSCFFNFILGDKPQGEDPERAKFGMYTFNAGWVERPRDCQLLCMATEGCEVWTNTGGKLVTYNCFLQTQGALDALMLPITDPGCGLKDESELHATCESGTQLCSQYTTIFLSGRRLCDPTNTPTLDWQRQHSICAA